VTLDERGIEVHSSRKLSVLSEDSRGPRNQRRSNRNFGRVRTDYATPFDVFANGGKFASYVRRFRPLQRGVGWAGCARWRSEP